MPFLSVNLCFEAIVLAFRRHRRLRGNILTVIELIVMICKTIAFIFPNAYLLGCHCCDGYHHAIGWSSFARWTCWNSVSLLSFPVWLVCGKGACS